MRGHRRSTTRGLLAGLLVAGALSLPAATASGQESAPGSTGAQRRAEARALGEIALSARRELRALEQKREASAGRAERKTTRCLKRAVDDLEAVQGEAGIEGSLELDDERSTAILRNCRLIGVLPADARIIAPAVQRASERMTALATGDPILRDGVKTWLAESDFYARVAAIRATACSVLAAWHRGGFEPSKVPRELLAFAKLVEEEEGSDSIDRLDRAERRLLQLGVSSRAALDFGLTLDELGLLGRLGFIEDEATPAG